MATRSLKKIIMAKLEEMGVSVENCMTVRRHGGKKLTMVVDNSWNPDAILEMMRGIYNIVQHPEMEAKDIAEVCNRPIVIFKKGKKGETTFMKKLPILRSRIQKASDGVALYQAMIRGGWIEKVDFLSWVTWMNPIYVRKYKKVFINIADARKYPKYMSDTSYELTPQVMIPMIVSKDVTEHAAKLRANKMILRIEVISRLLSGV